MNVMKPFLQQVATLYYDRRGAEMQHDAFVFPNRRAGVFFKKYLSEAAGKAIFSPAILTINGLFMQLSDTRAADPLRMLFLLYRIYARRSGATEPFDDFAFWGEMLLNDFDDVDKYMVDARRLFTNVTDLHDIDRDFSYLSATQIEAIRAFWSSFYPVVEGENRRHFLQIWQLLYDMYSEFRATLAAEGLGYEGMIFRDVVERMEAAPSCALPYRRIVFVGLNALSTVETRLLQCLQAQGVADFYWDAGSPMVTDPHNKASLFVTGHIKQFPSLWPLPPEKPNVPDIELIGVPSGIGQAKHVHALLLDLLGGRMMMSGDEALRTAVVLPDEALLIPVMHAIPREIERINVTLGYPLSGTPVASLMESILMLRKNIRISDGQCAFYHRETLFVLNHQYIRSVCPEDAAALVKDITERNRIYVDAADLDRNALLALIFSPLKDAGALSDYLIAVLQELNKAISALRPDDDDDADDAPASMDDLEQEFIFHCFTAINRMKSLISEAAISMTTETYARLLRRMTDTITIPFRGEPLAGLQVMGVLETRVLDFERLIILSVNEGSFPARTAANTFIPYNLRRGFGLPTNEHQDSIWAYHFYRLIARAKQVTLLYDTRTDGLQTGEVSRFVQQLRFHYHVPLHDKLVVYNISSSQPPALQVDKTAEVTARLSAYLHPDGEKALSASAINTYLDCPLKFYFLFIEGMNEEDEVAETIENSIFGSILHKTLEIVYQPFCGATVTADLLKLAAGESALTNAINRAFAELYFHTDQVRPLSGQHYLTGEMIRKYALKILEQDRRQTPFRYIGSERRMQDVFRLTDGRTVRLKGFIDRLDEVNGTTRIVDYKTGMKKPLEYKTPESLFDRTAAERPQAVMQVFMYAWMYGAGHSQPVKPVIYYLRELFSPAFTSTICEGKEKTPVDDFLPLREAFEANLRLCLDEILSPDTPFTQTASGKPCLYCPFTVICGKLST
jgi:RecB family exonuclease